MIARKSDPQAIIRMWIDQHHDKAASPTTAEPAKKYSL